MACSTYYARRTVSDTFIYYHLLEETNTNFARKDLNDTYNANTVMRGKLLHSEYIVDSNGVLEKDVTFFVCKI